MWLSRSAAAILVSTLVAFILCSQADGGWRCRHRQPCQVYCPQQPCYVNCAPPECGDGSCAKAAAGALTLGSTCCASGYVPCNCGTDKIWHASTSGCTSYQACILSTYVDVLGCSPPQQAQPLRKAPAIVQRSFRTGDWPPAEGENSKHEKIFAMVPTLDGFKLVWRKAVVTGQIPEVPWAYLTQDFIGQEVWFP